jgi:hypothetical protein
MFQGYLNKLLLITSILIIGSGTIEAMHWLSIPDYTWAGLVYLALLTYGIHRFVKASGTNPNAAVRRLMLASIMRLFGALIFLLITLVNTRPVNKIFLGFYCAYFCVFLLFEISQLRTNLRPDSEPRPKNENA